MKKILFSIFLSLFMLSVAHAATSPTVATVKLYKAWMSPNGDCSSPVSFFDGGATPTAVDMVLGPTFGTGSLAAGTYRCVIFQVSDQISFTPAANDGTDCVAGTSYTIDVCSDHGGVMAVPTTKNPETGATVSCTAADGTEDTVWVYISTYSTATTGSQAGSPFTPPTQSGDAVNGFSLASGAITISGNITATFVFGVNGTIVSQNGRCDMNPPSFGFTTAATP